MAARLAVTPAPPLLELTPSPTTWTTPMSTYYLESVEENQY